MSTPTPTFGAAVDAYIRDQRQFGRMNGKNSDLRYRAVLRLHHEDIGARRGPLRTDREDVKRTLARWRGNSQYNAHSVLISFYDWAMQEGLRKDNPARMVRRTKLDRPSVYRLTRAEASAIMDACENARERRVIYIGLLTGARVGELAALEVRHLERDGWVWFSEDISKGKKERWVPVLRELEPVIAEITSNARSSMFVVRTRLQKPGHPRLLRHSFGDHIAQYAGLRAAQALMGHESVETTARTYTSHPSLDELAGSVQGFRYRDDQNGGA